MKFQRYYSCVYNKLNFIVIAVIFLVTPVFGNESGPSASAVRGEIIYRSAEALSCDFCHGIFGDTHNAKTNVLPLVDLDAESIVTKISNFNKEGDYDIAFMMMHEVARKLDERGRKDVANFISSLRRPDNKLAEKGEIIYREDRTGKDNFFMACRLCHGPFGLGGNNTPRFTNLDKDYIESKIDDYVNDIIIDNRSYLMNSTMRTLSKADRKAVAEYISSERYFSLFRESIAQEDEWFFERPTGDSESYIRKFSHHRKEMKELYGRFDRYSDPRVSKNKELPPEFSLLREVIKNSVLNKSLPPGWVGSIAPVDNVFVKGVQLLRVGIYNGRYWPVKVRVIGFAELRTNPINTKYLELRYFDGVGDFFVKMDNYGDWVAKLSK